MSLSMLPIRTLFAALSHTCPLSTMPTRTLFAHVGHTCPFSTLPTRTLFAVLSHTCPLSTLPIMALHFVWPKACSLLSRCSQQRVTCCCWCSVESPRHLSQGTCHPTSFLRLGRRVQPISHRTSSLRNLGGKSESSFCRHGKSGLLWSPLILSVQPPERQGGGLWVLERARHVYLILFRASAWSSRPTHLRGSVPLPGVPGSHVSLLSSRPHGNGHTWFPLGGEVHGPRSLIRSITPSPECSGRGQSVLCVQPLRAYTVLLRPQPPMVSPLKGCFWAPVPEPLSQNHLPEQHAGDFLV